MGTCVAAALVDGTGVWFFLCLRAPLAMVWSEFFVVANVVLEGVCFCAV